MSRTRQAAGRAPAATDGDTTPPARVHGSRGRRRAAGGSRGRRGGRGLARDGAGRGVRWSARGAPTPAGLADGGPETLPAPLEATGLGRVEPEVRVLSTHDAAGRGTISLEELASMDVIHGPRRADPGRTTRGPGRCRRLIRGSGSRSAVPVLPVADPGFRRGWGPVCRGTDRAQHRCQRPRPTGPIAPADAAAWPRWTYSTIR